MVRYQLVPRSLTPAACDAQAPRHELILDHDAGRESRAARVAQLASELGPQAKLDGDALRRCPTPFAPQRQLAKAAGEAERVGIARDGVVADEQAADRRRACV